MQDRYGDDLNVERLKVRVINAWRYLAEGGKERKDQVT
jgi:hypothetical protein